MRIKLGCLVSCLLGSAFVLLAQTRITVVASEEGWVSKNHYQSLVSLDDLDRVPKWDPDAACPPLPPRRAMEKAADYCLANFDSVLKRQVLWRTKTITLRPVGGNDWIYVIELEPKENYGAIVRPMRIILLQDGTIVRPRLLEDTSAPRQVK